MGLAITIVSSTCRNASIWHGSSARHCNGATLPVRVVLRPVELTRKEWYSGGPYIPDMKTQPVKRGQSQTPEASF